MGSILPLKVTHLVYVCLSVTWWHLAVQQVCTGVCFLHKIAIDQVCTGVFLCTYWCVTDVCLYWCVTDVYWCFFLFILVCDWCVLFFPPSTYWCVTDVYIFSVHTGVWLMGTVFFHTYWCVTDVYWFFSLFCTYWCVTDVYWCLCYSASGHKRRQHQAESRAAPPCAEGRAAEHWWKLAKFKVQVKLTVTLWFGVANVHWAHVLHSCSA